MTVTRSLAVAEYTIKISREENYVRQALARMNAASPSDRVRFAGGGPERATAYHWRQAKRHMRKLSAARKLLAGVVS